MIFVLNVNLCLHEPVPGLVRLQEKAPASFNLQELDVLELPLARRIGVTVQDGPFPSIPSYRQLPAIFNGPCDAFPADREISIAIKPILSRISYVEGNYKNVLGCLRRVYSDLKRATLIKSFLWIEWWIRRN